MGEIAQLLQQRVGLNEQQAQSAEEAVLGYVRSKVPPQFQGMVDQFLGPSGGGTGDGTAAPAASGGLGGLLSEAESLFGK